jgi:hypothetical protein
LLASRGIILASVDQNFLNYSAYADTLLLNSMEGETDVRAWLLLEHLKAWQEWQDTPGNPFFQKVDMDNIALLGHSRGGEAVAIAALFNNLPYYPDDGTIAFDYGFNLRSIVALAPTDGEYRPAGQDVHLENVNYLVLHGTTDADVQSFLGTRQYSRISFTDGDDWVKSAFYIYGANHGQFNTEWGRTDWPGIANTMYNVSQIMPGEDQRQIAKVTIAAFLEATLQGEDGYLPLFRDYRTGADWLPDTIYLTQYEDSNTQFVATYDEDLNLATTTLANGTLAGDELTVWREQVVKLKPFLSSPLDELTSAVYIGWDNGATSATPSYTVTLPEEGLTLDENSVLVLSLADAEEEVNASDTATDLTLEVTDTEGESAELPLSSFSLLQPQLEVHIMKPGFSNSVPASEIIFQSFEFPLSEFVAENANFDPTSITTIRLVFDRTEAHVIVLDNLGFRE